MPHRDDARAATAALIAEGAIPTKDSCERCGSTVRVHKHHPDYSRPDLIEWLCSKCHGAEHAAMRKARRERMAARGNGSLITLAKAGELWHSTPSTVWRWARDGVKVGDETIRLATISVGIRIFTTAEYLSEFQAAIDAARAKLSDGDATPR